MFGPKPRTKPQELRFAVFGESGCGKTTLLASYYGTQALGGWEREHGYSLLAADAAQGKDLHDRFVGLEEGAFPASTTVFTETTFELRLPRLPDPVLRILWFDYPGEWWTQEPDLASVRAERQEAIARLLSCQVGFLVFDGARFREERTRYLVRVINQFRDNVRRHRQILGRIGRTLDSYPRNWVFVLSKADLFSDTYSAKDFRESFDDSAQEFLRDLAGEFPDSGGIGTRFLLLSSVRAARGRIVDPRSSLGLNLVAPLAFEAAMRQIRGVPPAFVRAMDLAAQGLEQLPLLLEILGSFLPLTRKLRALILLRRLSNVILRRKAPIDGAEPARALRRYAQELARKGDSVASVSLMMGTELASEASQRLVFLLDVPDRSPVPATDPDPELAELTKTWSGLSATARARILDLARARPRS